MPQSAFLILCRYYMAPISALWLFFVMLLMEAKLWAVSSNGRLSMIYWFGVSKIW